MPESKTCPKCGAKMHDQGGDYGLTRYAGKTANTAAPVLIAINLFQCEGCHFV